MLNLREQWQKLLRGDHLTDEELDQMIKQAEAAMPYLLARGERFHHAWLDTHIQLDELRGYLKSRKKKNG